MQVRKFLTTPLRIACVLSIGSSVAQAQDTTQDISFGSTTYAQLTQMRNETPSLSAAAYDNNPSQAAINQALASAPGDFHILWLFNPGHIAGNGQATPFGPGLVSFPSNKVIKAVYVWIPDNNGFYNACGNAYDRCIAVDAIEETLSTASDGSTSNSFFLKGINSTGEGHYIQVDVFFQNRPPAGAK